MAEVTVYDAIRMKAIEDNTVVNGGIDPVTGHLELVRFNGTEIDAGLVNVSPRIVTSGTRPVAPNVFEGLVIYETDTDRFYVWSGAAWIPRGQGTFVCTAATRPAHANGLKIYETDTKREYTSDGTTWLLGGAHMPHTESNKVGGSATTSGSTAYVDLPAPLSIVNFVKYRPDTKLLVSVAGEIQIDDPLASVVMGVDIGGTDTDIVSVTIMGGGTGNGFAGTVSIPGLAAATISPKIQWKVGGAGVVATMWGTWSMTVTETF